MCVYVVLLVSSTQRSFFHPHRRGKKEYREMQAMLGEGKGQVPWLDQQACLLTPGCTNTVVKIGSQA